MKRKIVLFLMIAAVFCTLFAGCGENENSNVTTSNDTTANEPQDTHITTGPTDATALNADEITYIQYNAMSAEEQKEIMDSFETIDEFFEWHSELEKTHQELQDKINSQKNSAVTTDPTEDNGELDETSNDNSSEAEEMTYLEYHAMSGAEQKKFINSFETIDAFIQWHDAAEQAYKDSLPEIDGTGPIDLNDFFGSN